jgi:DNA-binding transcriptional regulator GbsR (MarR family)
MSTDPNRKTLRHFYCTDGIWQIFEQMSEAMDRGVDELVNEAMRAFAEQNGYLAGPDTDAQPSGSMSPILRGRPPCRRPCPRRA